MKLRGGGERGFTILELMITVTVTALLLALAAPSWSNFVQKRQISSIAEQMGSFLVMAQSESVKRYEPLTVSYTRTGDTNWCVGMSMGMTACDCTETDMSQGDACAIEGIAKVFSNADVTNVAMTAASDGTNDGAFSYEPLRGLMANTADSGSFAFETANSNYSLTIDVTPTGRVSICTDASKKLNGYQDC